MDCIKMQNSAYLENSSVYLVFGMSCHAIQKPDSSGSSCIMSLSIRNVHLFMQYCMSMFDAQFYTSNIKVSTSWRMSKSDKSPPSLAATNTRSRKALLFSNLNLTNYYGGYLNFLTCTSICM